MREAFLHTVREALAGPGVALVYSGAFPDAHSARLIALCEAVLGEAPDQRTLRSRVAFVLVEAYQNVVRHAAYRAVPNNGQSLLLWRCTAQACTVTTSNPLYTEEAQALDTQLLDLRALDAETLKERYLERLQQRERTARGGAGLGLIELTRRAANPLRHRITPGDDGQQRIDLWVPLGEVPAAHTAPAALDHLRALIKEGALVLAFRGPFLPATAAALEHLMAGEASASGCTLTESATQPLPRDGRVYLLVLRQEEGMLRGALVAEVP